MAKKRTNSPPEMKQRKLRIAPQAVALTIAGSDPSGGAGLQADLKVFQQIGVYGMSVITLLTVQNTRGVTRVEAMAPELVLAQLDAVLDDIEPKAIKLGALGNASIVRAVAERLRPATCPVIIDPVLVSKHGDRLATDDVVAAYREHLLPLATLVTPNRLETERLTGVAIESHDDMPKVMECFAAFGARQTLVKFGREREEACHFLSDGASMALMTVPWVDADNTHGSGCVLSALITAALALGVDNISAAVSFAIERTLDTIYVNTKLGGGIHPVETRAIRRDEA